MSNLVAVVTIPADHPALPGHFPGHPVVPGAVLLNEVALAAAGCLGTGVRVTDLSAVKFLAPLAPAQPARIAFTPKGVGQAAFEVTAAGERKIVTGNLRYETASC